MTLKRTTIIFVGAVALAAWLAAAMTPGPAPASRPAPAPSPIDQTGAELASEIARLRERLRPDPAPREPVRNPFAFRVARPPASNRPPAGSAPSDLTTTGADDRAQLQLMLAGVAEEPGPDGVRRTAIITGRDQLALAGEGEIVTDRGVDFRVGTISADSVELTDLRDGKIHRLALK